MYAQKLEGESWIGEKMDKGKIDKMSGMWSLVDEREEDANGEYRSTIGTIV